MWRIVSKTGVYGIQTYATLYEAERACMERNRLSPQGWRPVKVA